MNIKPIKKSQVTISGTIDGVYKARQQLIVSKYMFSRRKISREIIIFLHNIPLGKFTSSIDI